MEYILKLTESEMKNLKIFLSRTNLAGAEAGEFLNLTGKIGKAEVVTDGE